MNQNRNFRRLFEVGQSWPSLLPDLSAVVVFGLVDGAVLLLATVMTEQNRKADEQFAWAQQSGRVESGFEIIQW